MAWKDASLLFSASSAWQPLEPFQPLSLLTGVSLVRLITMVGPQEGQLSFLKMLWR